MISADERAAWRNHAWHMRQLCDFVWHPDKNLDTITALKKGTAGLDLLLDELTAADQRATAMLGNDALVVERLREQNAKLAEQLRWAFTANRRHGQVCECDHCIGIRGALALVPDDETNEL